MIWNIKAPVWFGLALAALALFVWCILEAVDSGAMSAGLIWGVVVFGAIGLAAGILALIAQSQSGGVVRARDALTKGDSIAPTGSSGRGPSGSGYVPKGVGGVPQPVSGRSIT